MANEQTSVSRVADREELPLLLDKARQFALDSGLIFPFSMIAARDSKPRFLPRHGPRGYGGQVVQSRLLLS